jgi:hypothetical protein
MCGCGFERKLTPGASVEHLYVIAYSADRDDLITVTNDDAKRRSLTVIEDPRRKEISEAEAKGSVYIPAAGPWGPYSCPSCGQLSLQLWHGGWWD